MKDTWKKIRSKVIPFTIEQKKCILESKFPKMQSCKIRHLLHECSMQIGITLKAKVLMWSDGSFNKLFSLNSFTDPSKKIHSNSQQYCTLPFYFWKSWEAV